MRSRGRSEEDGARSSNAANESELTVLNKIRWFLVGSLSISVLHAIFWLWGTTVLLWGDTSANSTMGALVLVLVASASILVAGAAMSQLIFAFLRERGYKGPVKALILFVALCLPLSAFAWDGTLEDVARAMTVGVSGSFLLSFPGVLKFLRTRAKEDRRARQDAERRQREVVEEAKQVKRERLKRRREERKREESRREQAERDRVKREQEEERREQARRFKESRQSSQESGGKRRRRSDQSSAGDRGRDRHDSARPRTRSEHDILGVAPGASEDEIVAAYRQKVRMYHPDKVSDLAPEYMEIAEREMKEINAAYAKLKPKKR